jgi:hypothetical protein
MLQGIYVDCVEFYSEKLISNYVSIYLDNIIKKLDSDGKLRKKLHIKTTCKNFATLLDVL